MDPAVRRYLADLLGVARDLLGSELVGGYAAGSVALHAYQPGRSDVDVALVCRDALPRPTRQELVTRLRHEALPCPARGLELVVYTRSVAGSGTCEPGFEVELNTGAAMPTRVTLDPAERPAADGRFWYALDRSILHQRGHPLTGPPAAAVFADPSPDDLRTLMVAALRWWLARPAPPGDAPAPGAEDAVLNACRALVRLRDGDWLSKTAAGHRVITLGRDPGLVRRCVDARTGGPPPSAAAARAFQQRVLDEITAD
ncbi:nucleotidyltransferase domain-containing protein [Micromonospora sp. WMMD734]|uniref:Nucleotidyltransferase domain-containing protein n=1 Tax=Micromonospora humidisoli TaxID=2807622 RepID=A0ABS2JGA5_9ACTN|nr:nucleotidyltransferase domain-containing protein [Micromonospora humidisoli]MBM7085552.1 nucleotidyltransferase domain-containing protein [Micromonospora humidisoli]